jgi:hypothetical protein
MNLKRTQRLIGFGDALAWSVPLYYFGHYLTDMSYNYEGIKNFFLSEQPIENKITGAGLIGVIATATFVSELFALDGISDIITGEHHYFGGRILDKFMRGNRK